MKIFMMLIAVLFFIAGLAVGGEDFEKERNKLIKKEVAAKESMEKLFEKRAHWWNNEWITFQSTLKKMDADIQVSARKWTEIRKQIQEIDQREMAHIRKSSTQKSTGSTRPVPLLGEIEYSKNDYTYVWRCKGLVDRTNQDLKGVESAAPYRMAECKDGNLTLTVYTRSDKRKIASYTGTVDTNGKKIVGGFKRTFP